MWIKKKNPFGKVEGNFNGNFLMKKSWKLVENWKILIIESAIGLCEEIWWSSQPKRIAPFGLWDEGEMNDLKCTSNGHIDLHWMAIFVTIFT